jgi:DNA repair protein RadC
MQAQSYSIKEWAKDDRPREKLLSNGAENLSNAELLAILINKGTRQKSAVDLAREIMLMGRNNLGELGKLGVTELQRVKGIGQVKAITITAALELGRRRQADGFFQKPKITSSREMADFIEPLLKDLKHEVFAVVFLNQANKVNHFEVVSEGGMTATIADPRIILRKALENHATSLILCHNHPSGNLQPSRADETITQKIKEAARLLDIKLLDHIIISQEGYYSFSDSGKL